MLKFMREQSVFQEHRKAHPGPHSLRSDGGTRCPALRAAHVSSAVHSECQVCALRSG